MDTTLRVHVLGPFRVERDGEPLTAFKSNKVRALLAYLAVEHEQAHHRDVLADLLWPTSANALALLRDALSNLRRVLDDRDADAPVIRVVADTLQLDAAQLWLDVAAFDALASEAEDDALERAVAHYRGDFLAGLTISRSPNFEAWTLLHQEAYRRQMVAALYRLTTLRLERGDCAAAQDGARRQLALDNYSEDAHRQLLRALACDGQRNQALAHYAAYCALLDEELGVKPDVRTTALYQRIREGSLRRKDASATVAQPAAIFTDTPPSFTFVGRESELQRMDAALQQAQQGAGQLLFVTGEAGSGKTTLAQAFARRLVARPGSVVVVRGTCNAHLGAGDPYLPFREMLRLLTGDFDVPAAGGGLTPAYEQRLEALIPTVMQALRDEAPSLIGGWVPARTASARQLETPRSTPPSPAALCDQVTRVLRTVARQRALVLILDDLQWADRGTLNLLVHLGRRLEGIRLLILGLYRSTEVGADHPLWPIIRELQRVHGDLFINLAQAGGAAFVDAFLDHAPNALDADFRAQLTRQTGGHALFTAALVQQLQDEGALIRDVTGRWQVGAALDWSQVPPRVEAVIASHLAQLSRADRELLSIASVEGARFTAEVVARAAGQPLKDVEHKLQTVGLRGVKDAQHHLIYALGVERVGARRVGRYQFRHALFQNYLYTQLDAVQRARYHEAVGRAMETLYNDHLDAVAGPLAYHFEAAGLIKEAVRYLVQAGQRAYQLSAPGEALDLSRRGLALLESLPESTARHRLELALQVNLEAPLLVTQGWGAPERAAVLTRAYTLAQSLSDTSRLLIVLYDLSDLCTAQARHSQALAYAEQLLALAQQAGDPGYEALGYRMTGTAHFFLGHYQEARTHLENGLRCYTTVMQQATYTGSAPIERAIFLRAYLPHILLVLGYPEQAVASSRAALAGVQPDGPAYAQAMMLTMAGVALHTFARQPEITLRYAEELLALTERYDLAAFRGWAIFCRGWAQTALGNTERGLSQMVEGLECLQASGVQGTLPAFITILAETYLDTGAIAQGETEMQHALALARQNDERFHLAEMHRVQGVLHRKRRELDTAEASLLRAIDIAQAQSAKLWELRATLDLARLWRDQGRANEAHTRLVTLYGEFTEGFEMPDLIAARQII